MYLRILGSVLFFAAAALCRGALTWEKTQIDAVAPIEQERMEAKFPFKNTSDSSVTIVSVHTSCGCTTATLEKHTYAPGESGEIHTVFSFEGRTGNQEKTIQVTTSDSTAPTTLVLRVAVLEAFTIKPRILVWKKGSAEKSSQTAVFTATRSLAATPIDVRCDSALFTVKVVPLTPGQRYELQVTPQSIETTGKAAIRIDIELSGGKKTSTVVYAVIQ
jgi:FtsP/CotA-like multicopper oxidase with cupredoxin domain